MHTWMDAGTDIATIGAWDADLPRVEQFVGDEQLMQEAAEGKVFVVLTGADGGGRVDVFVDEPVSIPHTKPVGNGPNLLHLPSGRLLIGGAEDYRSPKPQITSDQEAIELPAGMYAIRCYEPQKYFAEKMTKKAAKTAGISEDDYAHYLKAQRGGVWAINLGCPLALALTFVPMYWRWWYGLMGIVAGGLAFMAVTWICETLFFDKRAKALDKQFKEFSGGIAGCTLIFHLERTEAAGDLKGGSVSLG